jgi:alpha-galactosidase
MLLLGVILILGATVVASGSDGNPQSARASVLAMAPTPPMGWSSWYRFDCRDTEAIVVRVARAMKSSGMAAAGYRYVVVDDCWMWKTRDSQGALLPNRQKFPHGIPWLAHYVHSLGLKLGLYLDTGAKTCTGWQGSKGHYDQDSRTVVSWGVDYVKLDYCDSPPAPAPPLYAQFRQSLDRTGHPIMLNVSAWGRDSPWKWTPGIGTTWRTNRDYYVYGAPRSYWKSMLKVLDIQVAHRLERYARPGAFNDPNNMLVGVGWLKAPEERSQISLWSIVAAPLFAGGDLSTASKTTVRTLTNREVIAVDQDPAVKEGTRVEIGPRHQVWLRHLGDGSLAVVLLNTGSQPELLHADAGLLGLSSTHRYKIRDLWEHRSWSASGSLSSWVGPRDVAMYRVSG